MTVQNGRGVDLVGIMIHVKGLLFSPVAEWQEIEKEETTIGELYKSYVIPLAALGPVCGAIGLSLFGYGMWFVHYRPSIGTVLSASIAHFLLSLVEVFFLALIIDALAPNFGGQKNRLQAFKVAAYSYTAAWVGGVFALLPALTLMGALVGLYGFYLLYLGLPRLMKAPEAQATGYSMAVVVAAVILYVVAGFVAAPMMVPETIASLETAKRNDGGSGSASLDLGNGQSLDIGKLKDAATQLENLTKQSSPSGTGGTATPVSVDALKALLPESLSGGFKRTETQNGALLGGVHVEATYENADKRVVVGITDLAAAGGAIAALASSFGVESERETATGFEKISRVDGRLTAQEWDGNAYRGKYGVLVEDRFLINAEGTVSSFDDLKNAVAAVGPDRVLKLK